MRSSQNLLHLLSTAWGFTQSFLDALIDLDQFGRVWQEGQKQFLVTFVDDGLNAHRYSEWSGVVPSSSVDQLGPFLFGILPQYSEETFRILTESNVVPILLEEVQFENYWMRNLVFQAISPDPNGLLAFLKSLVLEQGEELQLKFTGLKVVQNLALYGTRNWHTILELPSPPSLPIRRVLVAIVSRQESREMRLAIRSTWLGALCEQASGLVEVTIKFFVGVSNSTDPLSLSRGVLEEEVDLVQLGVVDIYANLSAKMQAVFAWAQETGNFTHILRLDDDVYIRPALLVARLQQAPLTGYWWGSFTHTAVPVRDTAFPKDFIPRDLFPFDAFYPLFARGFAYILSMDLVRAMLLKSPTLDHSIPFDDAALGVHVLQLVVEDDWKVFIHDADEEEIVMNSICIQDPFSSSILPPTSAVIHHVSPEQIHCMHDQDSRREGNLCVCASNVGWPNWYSHEI